jgi:hypothetical protein
MTEVVREGGRILSVIRQLKATGGVQLRLRVSWFGIPMPRS